MCLFFLGLVLCALARTIVVWNRLFQSYLPASNLFLFFFTSSWHTQIRSLLHKAVQKWRQKRDHEKSLESARRNAGALRLRRSESGDSFTARNDDDEIDAIVVVQGLGRAPTTSLGRTLPAGSSLSRAESEKRAMSLARAAQGTDHEQLMSAGSQSRPSLARAHSSSRKCSQGRSGSRGAASNSHSRSNPNNPNRSMSKARSATNSSHGDGGGSSSGKRSASRPMGFGRSNEAKRPGASFLNLGSKQPRDESVLGQINRTAKHEEELELPKWSRSEVHVFFSQVSSCASWGGLSNLVAFPV